MCRKVRDPERVFDADLRLRFFHPIAPQAVFKREAPKYRYIHLATHGYLNNASPPWSA